MSDTHHNAGICGNLEIGAEVTECSGWSDKDGIFYDYVGTKFTAFKGSLFNPDNKQHTHGSDGLRLAIGIQMARDRRDFNEADRIRMAAWDVFRVENNKDSTTVVCIADFGNALEAMMA